MAILDQLDDPTPRAFVSALISMERELAAAGSPVRATWLNHYSIQVALSAAAEAVDQMDVCGVDGQLLKWLLRHPVRTSADLVVPVLLQRDQSIGTVLAIGGRGDRTAALEAALSKHAGRPIRVHSMDGYEGLLRGVALEQFVRRMRPDLVLIGLGAGLQEQVLLEAARAMDHGYALTCGGFLDQVLQAGYYPSWAYPLRLNWAVRLAREPRRLWRRYTTEAFRAVVYAATWRRVVSGVPGVLLHAQMCTHGVITTQKA